MPPFGGPYRIPDLDEIPRPQHAEGPAALDRDRRSSPLLIFFGIGWLGALATVYTDYLWFVDLGHTNVFWVNLLSPWVVGLAFALVFFALLYVEHPHRAGAGAQGPHRGTDGRATRRGCSSSASCATSPVHGSGRVLLGLSIVMAWIAGASMSDTWQLFQQAINATRCSRRRDPQFHIDVGFFVFQLPALRATVDWLGGTILVVLIVTAAVHVLDGAIRPVGARRRLRAAREGAPLGAARACGSSSWRSSTGCPPTSSTSRRGARCSARRTPT